MEPDFLGHTVRVATIDNEPWFVARDVCSCLGHTNPSVAVRSLGDTELSKLSLGSGRASLIVSESGLYKLVMRSDKPQAKEFQNWVTKVVLPAIRKDGGEGESEGGESPTPVGALGVESKGMPGVEPHASN